MWIHTIRHKNRDACAKRLLKAHTILWICISIQSLQDADIAIDFVKMKNPFNSKEDVPNYVEGNQGGVQRRLEPGVDETKEETSVHEQQPASQDGVRHFALHFVTSCLQSHGTMATFLSI